MFFRKPRLVFMRPLNIDDISLASLNCGSQDLTIQTLSNVMVSSSWKWVSSIILQNRRFHPKSTKNREIVRKLYNLQNRIKCHLTHCFNSCFLAPSNKNTFLLCLSSGIFTKNPWKIHSLLCKNAIFWIMILFKLQLAAISFEAKL